MSSDESALFLSHRLDSDARKLTIEAAHAVGEARFRFFIDSVTDYAIYMLDPEGKVTSWNAGAQRIKGYTADEIIGQRFSRFFPAEDVKAGKCEHVLKVAAREGRFEDEAWRVRKDGSRFWANVIVTCVLAADGKLIGFAKVTRDLTERKRLEEEQRTRMQAEADLLERKKLDELREQLIAVVGHDLRGPLASVSLATNVMLKRGTLHGTDVETAALIARNTDRMLKMVSQLLDFTHARLGGGIPLNPQPMDIAQLCAELLSDCECANPGRAMTLNCDVNTSGVWDRDRLGQVVANLLGNAIQHGDPSQPIEMRVLDDGAEHVRLSATNGGPPIPADALPTIFDPFRRAATRRSTTKDSLGLGLYIVHTIVQAHKGTVSVESNQSGTTFTVQLPRNPS